MAGGLRKFSEKIAFLNQKQAEDNAAFETIMCQVKSIVWFIIHFLKIILILKLTLLQIFFCIF